jgi:hypothetical protein
VLADSPLAALLSPQVDVPLAAVVVVVDTPLLLAMSYRFHR